MGSIRLCALGGFGWHVVLLVESMQRAYEHFKELDSGKGSYAYPRNTVV